jgi:serine/threonine-protein kinase
MELLAGRHSLRDLIRASGSLAVGEAVQVARDVLAGLAAIHARGLVHCDVKSGNVMTGGGETKLIDFGIARSLQADRARRTSVGSLHAMSPEQLRGEALTPASDLFAVGVVLFESLTGRVPFPGATPAEVMAAHAGGPIGPPSASASGIGEALDAAVLQALAHDPAQRFASAEAMDAALGAAVAASTPHRAGADDTTTVIAAAAPARLPAALPLHCPSRPRRRSPPALAAFAVLAVPALVAALLVFGLVTRGNGDPTGSQPPAGSPTPPPGTVLVPNTIGLSEAEAEAAARAAGLNWRIEWRVVAGETPGVYDQEPAAGTPVQPGSRFVMYAYRSR